MAIANTVLIHKKSATPGSTPSSLANGEIALNFADGKLYFKNLGGATTYFYANGFSTVTANGTSLIPTAPNQTLTFSAGNNISITTNTTTQTINIALSNAINITGQLTTGNNSTFGNTGGNNYIQIDSAVPNVSAAVSSPRISAAGSDPNIGITLVPKGTYGVVVGGGSVSQPGLSFGSTNRGIYNPSTGTPSPNGDVGFVAGGYEQARIYGTAAAVNYAFITGNVTGFPVTFGAQGSDPNIGINLTPKGTGIIYANSNNTSTSTSTGALVALGGIGVLGNVYSGGTVTGNHAGSGAGLFNIPYANSSNTQVITTAATGTFYPVMVNAVTGNLGANASSGLSYNAANNTLFIAGNTYANTITISYFAGPTNSQLTALNAVGANTRGGLGYFDFLSANNLSYGGVANTGKYFRIDSTGALQIINGVYSTNILNLTDAGALTVPGNVNGSYIIGNGSLLTNLPSSVGNSVNYANIANTVNVSTATTGTFYPMLVNAVTGNLGANAASALNFNAATGQLNLSSTLASTSNLTGALVVAGGVGVSGNVYVGGRVGWANSNSVSVIYQYYNSVTASLDTVFG